MTLKELEAELLLVVEQAIHNAKFITLWNNSLDEVSHTWKIKLKEEDRRWIYKLANDKG